MACGCKKGGALATYTVTFPDGKKGVVTSLTQAISVARRSGGTYVKNP